MQYILHRAAQVFFLKHKSGHVPILLKTLLSLPVAFRIKSRILGAAAQALMTWLLPPSLVSISGSPSSPLGSSQSLSTPQTHVLYPVLRP